MPHKDPAARKKYQAIWYLRNKERHKARAAARYMTHRQLRLQQLFRYSRTAAGMLTMVRAKAKRRQG